MLSFKIDYPVDWIWTELKCVLCQLFSICMINTPECLPIPVEWLLISEHGWICGAPALVHRDICIAAPIQPLVRFSSVNPRKYLSPFPLEINSKAQYIQYRKWCKNTLKKIFCWIKKVLNKFLPIINNLVDSTKHLVKPGKYLEFFFEMSKTTLLNEKHFF